MQTEHTTIRKSMFETNSSSTHSISIDQKYFSICTELSGIDPVVIDGNIEFGWEQEEYWDSQSKSSYAWIYVRDWAGDRQEEYKKILDEVILAQTGASQIEYEGSDGCIDHQSVEGGQLNYLFEDRELLRNFIFNRHTILETDNDNH